MKQLIFIVIAAIITVSLQAQETQKITLEDILVKGTFEAQTVEGLRSMKVGDVPTKIEPKLPVRTEHCEQPMYTRQMEHYVESIRNRTQPVPGLVEGQIIPDIVDAAYKSSKTGEVVNL